MATEREGKCLGIKYKHRALLYNHLRFHPFFHLLVSCSSQGPNLVPIGCCTWVIHLCFFHLNTWLSTGSGWYGLGSKLSRRRAVGSQWSRCVFLSSCGMGHGKGYHDVSCQSPTCLLESAIPASPSREPPQGSDLPTQQSALQWAALQGTVGERRTEGSGGEDGQACFGVCTKELSCDAKSTAQIRTWSCKVTY